MDDLRAIVAAAIRAQRAAAGMTQADVATAMGIDRAVISRIESGERAVRMDGELVLLCQALGCTVRQLLVDATPEQRQALGIRG